MILNEVVGTASSISLGDYKESCEDKESLEILAMGLFVLTWVRVFS